MLAQVVMLFERDFWGGADMFGRLAPSTKDRGKFFLFYSYTGISGLHPGLLSASALWHYFLDLMLSFCECCSAWHSPFTSS